MIVNSHESIRMNDMSILLAYLHTDTPFDSYLLNTVANMVHNFKDEYAVNDINNIKINKRLNSNGLLVGRYHNDVYYKGNPWVLTTAALAMMLKNIDLESRGILSLDREFFKAFDLDPDQDRKTSTERLHTIGRELIQSLIDIEIHNKNNQQDRERVRVFSEQIDRENFSYLSADELTWNYVEILRSLV